MSTLVKSSFMEFLLNTEPTTGDTVVQTGSRLRALFSTVLLSAPAEERMLDVLAQVKKVDRAFNCAPAGEPYHARDLSHRLQHAPVRLAGSKGNQFYNMSNVTALATMAVHEWLGIYHRDFTEDDWKKLKKRSFTGGKDKLWSKGIM